MFAADEIAALAQEVAQHSGTGERMLHVQPVDLAHQFQILHRNRSRLVVRRRASRTRIDLQGLLPDLRVQCLHVRIGFALLAGGGENCLRTLEQLGLPLRNLVRMDIESLSKLRQRPVALHSSPGHFRLERR
jgi:hypothetical protein